jgi:hypothetical protein
MPMMIADGVARLTMKNAAARPPGLARPMVKSAVARPPGPARPMMKSAPVVHPPGLARLNLLIRAKRL